jgi:hypothetical protein
MPEGVEAADARADATLWATCTAAPDFDDADRVGQHRGDEGLPLGAVDLRPVADPGDAGQPGVPAASPAGSPLVTPHRTAGARPAVRPGSCRAMVTELGLQLGVGG